MRRRSLPGIALATLLAACSTAPLPHVGADADVHGCRASAGNRWCARTASCERPWELAARERIANEASAIEVYCAAPVR